MKRLICMIFIFAAMMCVLASAAQEILPTDGKYSVEYDAGSANAGKKYVLAVVRAHDTLAVSYDNLVYINTSQADEQGKVKFENFVPMEICDSSVLISSENMEAPVLVGIICQSTTSGSIVSYGTAAATVSVYSKESLIETAVTDQNGNYNLKKAAKGAKYRFIVTKNGYLSYTAYRTADKNGVFGEIDIRSAAGDLDGSGKILINDLSYIIRSLNTPDPLCDLDASGKVDAQDITILIKNFNRTDIEEQ